MGRMGWQSMPTIRSGFTSRLGRGRQACTATAVEFFCLTTAAKSGGKRLIAIVTFTMSPLIRGIRRSYMPRDLSPLPGGRLIAASAGSEYPDRSEEHTSELQSQFH